jgi:hypothetical protein
MSSAFSTNVSDWLRDNIIVSPNLKAGGQILDVGGTSKISVSDGVIGDYKIPALLTPLDVTVKSFYLKEGHKYKIEIPSGFASTIASGIFVLGLNKVLNGIETNIWYYTAGQEIPTSWDIVAEDVDCYYIGIRGDLNKEIIISITGTDYDYTIDGTDAQSSPVYHEEGTFTTLNEDEDGFFDAIADDPRKQARKILRDGQWYILHNDRIYNMNGTEMK